MKDFNEYIKKSHLKAVEKFNEELNAWAKETGEDEATLYEDANTSFTLRDIKVHRGYLQFYYDGSHESHNVVRYDEDEKRWYEEEYDGIMDYIRFWRKCLNRAKRYWEMDPDKLDKIQDGEADDINDEEE